jgi:gliding motility-associated-like protein
MRVLDTLICRGDSFRVELFSNADTAILFACNGLPLGFSKYKIDADTVWVKPNQNGCCQVATYFDDGEGCVLVKFDTVCVDKPFADFTIPANGVFCGSQNVTFVNTSTQGIKPLNYPAGVWNIYHNGQATPIATVNGVQDLTYNFTLPGTYDVEYIVHSTFGCTDTAKFTTVITINENPTAAFTQNADTICINNTVSFTDISTYPTTAGTITWFWDYPNNTNVTQNVTNPTHFYNIPGLYQTVLVVQLANGCTDTSAGQSLLVLGNVIADFSTSDDSLCGNTGTINFTSTSTPISGVNYCWNFGDGTNPYACMSNSTNPSHTFTLTSPSGFQCFTIKLLISNSFGCIDSVAKTVCIFSNPVAGILTVNNNGCSPYTAYITDNSSSLNTISNYLIDWGEPTPTSSAIPPSLASHTYVTPGTFNVVYTITTIHGCTSIVNHQFTAYPLPTAFAGNDTSVCGGDVIQIGKVAIAGESYNWYSPLGVSFLPNNGVSNPLVSPVADITYCIEVANQFGCKDSDCVDVKVIPLVLANACCDTIICLNTPVTFSASGAISYQWDGLTDTSFHSTDSIISFIPVTSGIYEVTVTGPCNTATATVEVTVVPPPTINLEPNITIVAGQPYGILSVSAAGNSVVWSPNYNITCTNCPNPTVFPDVSTTYVVTVTDPYNCTTSDSITISVLCDRTNAIYIPNAFTPNTADKNSYFYIQGTGVKEIVSWKIFNRWGDMVWMGEHVPINVKESGWNGVYKGVAVSSDVYMYQMVVECHNGNKFPINGNVTVIR